MAKPKRGVYCKCDYCGKEVYMSENRYNTQKIHACSIECRNYLKGKDYAPGAKFGMLTVVSRGESKFSLGRLLHCKCDCGKENDMWSCNRGRTKSCGCLGGKVTHGMTGTNEWRIWNGINERCNNKNHEQYYQYGGRGITVGYKDFSEFYADMGDRPGKEYSIDRIDNSKGYEKGNCRRATMKEQSNNRRSNVKCVIDGESHTLQERADKLGMNRKTLKRYILKGKIKGELYNYKPDKWDTKSNAF